jgi:polysaccharide export outer membrane protein
VVTTALCLTLVAAGGCSRRDIAPAPVIGPQDGSPFYHIGPGDTLDLFVWHNEELTRTLQVRPDGRISVPLIGDVEAAGRSPEEVARDIEERITRYVVDPQVTVMVAQVSGTFDQQIRVIGEAQKPRAIPYRDRMTVLDVMIEVGGLTEFASGNRAVIVRKGDSGAAQYRVRLDDLIRDGDIDANVDVQPGDILIVPQRYL